MYKSEYASTFGGKDVSYDGDDVKKVNITIFFLSRKSKALSFVRNKGFIEQKMLCKLLLLLCVVHR